MGKIAGGNEHVRADSLLLSVVEHLKVPLTTIARQAELGQLTGQAELTDVAAIRTQALAALTLLDSYLLGLELMNRSASLELEPVSVSSTLMDAAHDLDQFARQYRVELEVVVGGKFAPVMSHPNGLRAALLSLGFALIESQAARDVRQPRRVVLATHRTPFGVVAGAYGQHEALSTDRWRAALGLVGKARQPLTSFMPGSGAGLFVADTIMRSMHTQLRVGRYLRQSGLAATLQPSHQLTFV